MIATLIFAAWFVFAAVLTYVWLMVAMWRDDRQVAAAYSDENRCVMYPDGTRPDWDAELRDFIEDHRT